MPDGPEGLTVVFNLGTPERRLPGRAGRLQRLHRVPHGRRRVRRRLQEQRRRHRPVHPRPSYVPASASCLDGLPGLLADRRERHPAALPRQADDHADPRQRPAARRPRDRRHRHLPDRRLARRSSRREERGLRRPEDQRLQLHHHPASTTPSRRSTTCGLARPLPTPSTRTLINERAYDGVRVPSYSGFALDSALLQPGRRHPAVRPRQGARSSSTSSVASSSSSSASRPPRPSSSSNIIKQQGEEVGMKITLESQEQGAYVNRMFSKGGDYEAGCFRSTPLHRAGRHPPRSDHRRRRQPRLLQQPRGRPGCSTRPARRRTSRSRKAALRRGAGDHRRRGAADHHPVRPVRQRLRRREGRPAASWRAELAGRHQARASSTRPAADGTRRPPL